MLNLDTLRDEFGRQLSAPNGKRVSLDQALAHVLALAYAAGANDADNRLEHIARLKDANQKLSAFAREKDQRAADLACAGHRLALELECLLADTKDTAIMSKWWDTGFEAIEAWRQLDPQQHISPLGMD